MDSRMVEDARELAGWQSESEVLSISTTRQPLKDRRGKQGKRSPLERVLTDVR
jgi:hypothetical protein